MWIVVLGETLCDAQQGIIRHFIWKNLRTKFFYQFIVVETNNHVIIPHAWLDRIETNAGWHNDLWTQVAIQISRGNDWNVVGAAKTGADFIIQRINWGMRRYQQISSSMRVAVETFTWSQIGV